MPDIMMNTREVSEYLGINEKQVYALIKADKIPCTRVTGKWVFHKNLIDEWITGNSRSAAVTKDKKKNIKSAVLAAGSNDPNLDILLSFMKLKHPEFNMFTCSTGSTEGLRLLKDGYVDVSWCHLYDPQSGSYNIPFISEYFKNIKITVVHLFYRELGFITPAGKESAVTKFSDLTKKGIKFINRQKGSGTRLFIDHCIKKEAIDTKKIAGYEDEVFTHFEVGLSILSGQANAGICTVAIAKLMGLPFAPLIKESFDMVCTQDMFFNKGIQAFIDTLKSEELREKIRPLGNYDFNDSGRIIYSSV